MANITSIMRLKNRLKYWRHMNQMEQKEFAEFLGVARQQYNRWERQVVQPNIETAWALAKKLNTKMDDLFEEQE